MTTQIVIRVLEHSDGYAYILPFFIALKILVIAAFNVVVLEHSSNSFYIFSFQNQSLIYIYSFLSIILLYIIITFLSRRGKFFPSFSFVPFLVRLHFLYCLLFGILHIKGYKFINL